MINNAIDPEVTVFPNPAKEKLRFNIISEKAGNLKYQIVDLSGKICRSGTIQIEKGMNDIQLNIASIPAGMYYLKIYDLNAHTLYKSCQILIL